MSAFGGGFGGGFGQNNQQSAGFGGFGTGTTPNTGFAGFGSTNTGGSIFGGGSTGVFGSSGGAFGSTTNNTFGAKPSGFGTAATTTGGGLFGNNTATAGTSAFGGGGGFGSTNTTSSPFGGGTSGGGIFGQNKPAFGGATSSPFGGAASSSPFGGAATGAFGAPASTALGAGVPECQGTGSVQFQAFVEKEPNSSSNQQNSFQNICFQQPYQKYSLEELRMADYAAGRKFGNASNQPGAFGQTNFGGFGSTNTGTPFGATNTATTGTTLFGGTGPGFGTSQPASTAFGANTTSTGGGLFGAKPATSLFGAQPASNTGGGLFGGTGTTGGFGSNTTNAFGQPNNNTGTSLFGTNANKPSTGFNFGTSQPAATGTAFGNTATTNAFGGGGLFGNNQQQQNASTPFGAQQPAATSNPFGGFGTGTAQQTGTGSSLFGTSNQQKPATGGLFGTPPAATGGLFGNPQPASNTNLFGAANNTQGGGIFGSGNKPAAPGTSLFGGTNPQTNTGGGGLFNGFGNQNQIQIQNQQQQQTTGSLFNNLNNNNLQKPSLFGTTGTQQGGGGLFGSSTGSQQQGNLFGTLNNSQQQQQQQPQNSLFGSSSLFGSQQNQQAPQSLTASVGDLTAYGTGSMFSTLTSAQQISNPGPLATPLSTSIKAKKSAALPLYKLNSASSSKFMTPTKKGYGFSYSTYGTPNSVSSTASTPGFTSSLVNGGSFSSFGRGLGKSISTSNLRRTYGPEDSILAPGAFAASPHRFGSTGSMKKLSISRNIRQDLFAPPNSQSQSSSTSPLSGILKKRVSFTSESNGTSSPLKQVNNAPPDAETLGFMRPKSNTNGPKTNGTATPPEMEQVSNSNNQLAIVNEEESSANQSPTAPEPATYEDKEAGEYWCLPPVAALKKMSRQQLSRLPNFVVGRNNIGKIEFLHPVDLTGENLDTFLSTTVQFDVRTASIYTNPGTKPLQGKGMNVPSRISLENSWPRNKDNKTVIAKGGNRAKKHMDRLKRVKDTEFVGYDAANGIWTFIVPHYTTYSCPDDDDDDDDYDDETDGDEFGQSTLSPPPDTTPRAPESTRMDESFASTSKYESEPEDTFEFRKKKIFPGAFDDGDMYVDEDMEGSSYMEQNQESFLDERSAGSQSEIGVEEPMDQDDVIQDNESVSIMDQEMAGSFPAAGNTAELDEDSQNVDEDIDVEGTPGAIVRARMRAVKNMGTPRKFAAANDWASTLKTTISPQKQDRALLKSLVGLDGNDSALESEPTPVARRVVSDGRGFATSIDLMNSLFGQTRSPVKKVKVPASSKGFEWPYTKRPKTDGNDTSKMTEKERSFHESMKPTWGPDGTLVYAAPSNPQRFARSSRRARERDGLLTVAKAGVVSESRDIRFAKFSNEASAEFLAKQKAITIIDCIDGVPSAKLPNRFSFTEIYNDDNARDPAAVHEKLVWQLASILFDTMYVRKDLEDCTFDVAARLRKDNLSAFWQKLVEEASNKHVALAKSDEEKAVACLSGHKIAEACGHLMNNKDFRLASLVALIGSKNSLRKDMRQQLKDWRTSNMLSEFSQPIRAIYELLAGNVCVCEGMKSSGIEDRIDTFGISKRFGLDWRQAFGLRLWYGTLANESIEDAVTAFAEDLANDKETSRPHAWYVEQKVPTLWEDPSLEHREDLLWVLLRLNTFQDSDLEDVLSPENSQLSPLDIRLSWQLSQALLSNGTRNDISFTENGEEKTDRTTLSFAAQLTNEGSWVDAVFVLLHLSSAGARIKAIQDHLARHAGRIGAADSLSFKTLTQTFKIPASWIWEAKALYMRSVEKNPRGEVECLIRAGSFNEAHRTFAKEVAPKAVVELDYDTLRALLRGFEGKEHTIAEWHLGGEIYQDFLDLLLSDKKGEVVKNFILERLLSGLPQVVESSRHPAFMETVAIKAISGVVAKAVISIGKRGEKSNTSKILRLPLTEDKYLKHTVELSLEYYRGVMASAR